MKNILFLILLLLLLGCRKECRTVSLGELQCQDGYISVSDTRYANYRGNFGHYENELIVINDSINYFTSFDSTKPFNIDFAKSSLVAVKIEVGAGRNVSSNGGLCYDPVTGKWMFNIEYTISDQCKGSGIYSMNFTAVLICPKLPENIDLVFKVRDVNPF